MLIEGHQQRPVGILLLVVSEQTTTDERHRHHGDDAPAKIRNRSLPKLTIDYYVQPCRFTTLPDPSGDWPPTGEDRCM